MIRYIGDDLGANMGGMINWGDSKCPDQVILSDVVGGEFISMSLHKCGKQYLKTTITRKLEEPWSFYEWGDGTSNDWAEDPYLRYFSGILSFAR